jgi:hypothetical protein
MKAVWFVVFLAISASAVAQQKEMRQSRADDWRADEGFTSQVMYRAHQVTPRRRDAPMREINITDEEIREVQAATKSWLPDVYLNISPVVTGCPCEDGPACKEQVYIVADLGEKSVGLMLSRIKNEWKVGDVQRWWVRYARLFAERDKMEWSEYKQAEFKMAREFPLCSVPETERETPKTARASDFTK